MLQINLNRGAWCKPVLAVLLGIGLALAAKAAEPVLRTEANVMIELPFTASRVHGDPFNEVTLDVIFTDPKGHEFRVPAFWAGTNLWKVRYASPVVGTHRFRSQCSDVGDAGLQGVTGKVEVKSYSGRNPLYAHGPIRVAANHRYFEHTDGTPFFWLGDTWWMGLSARLHWPEDVQKLTADRKQKGFNVIQLVAGLFPDMHPFDPRGANEAGYPWETNYARIRPEYFDAADRRLTYLVDQGFTPCIVGAWGYFLPWMGVEKAKAQWRYLIARYGAMPVVWCAAGEANLPWYLVKNFPYDDREQVHGWTEVMRYMHVTDPFHRPITIHPTGIGRLSARHATDDASLLDIDMLQTPHGQGEAVPITVSTVRESYADKPMMPVINGEASFEMLNDSLPTEWTRRMFWVCLMNGAAGHTYGANGLWQVNRPGDPHGASPHGGNYGKITWEDAMNLPGSRQVGLAKRLFTEFPWQKFEPHPEWVSFVQEVLPDLGESNWIWYPEGDPTKDAPVEKRYFRKQFALPRGRVIRSAVLRLSADDRFTAYLNGHELGSVTDWRNGRSFANITAMLQPGSNVVAVEAENLKAAVSQNPAGLIGVLTIEFADGTRQTLVSDATWRCTKEKAGAWNQMKFDDSAWQSSMSLGRYGRDPWGKFGAGSAQDVPYAVGIPGRVTFIYAPVARPVEVCNLKPGGRYKVSLFDPVTGQRRKLGTAKPDANGKWCCPNPADMDHDWVLVLENAGK
jgi:Protein of unknown function (DUF4038)/Domain of unknown function (DUF5060)